MHWRLIKFRFQAFNVYNNFFHTCGNGAKSADNYSIQFHKRDNSVGMLHCQCNMNGVSKLKSCSSFKGLILLCLSCSLHTKSYVCNYIAIFSTAKVMKFWEGSIQTSIFKFGDLHLFLDCCFGILLMSMSFSFKWSIFQVNLGTQCQMTAFKKTKKEFSINTVHCHTHLLETLISVALIWTMKELHGSTYNSGFSWKKSTMQQIKSGILQRIFLKD